jgi:hypothetical protein
MNAKNNRDQTAMMLAQDRGYALFVEMLRA